MRRGHLIALLCVGLLWPADARADEDSKRTCAAAFTAAQRLMRTGGLLEARKKLVLCGGPQCPAVMQPDCQQWLASVESSIPTVVFQASLEGGEPAREVLLSVDGGEPFALDGRAMSLDPGRHEVTFTAQGFQPVSKSFVVSEGEKLRREAVILLPEPRPALVQAPTPVPVPTALPAPPSRFSWPVLAALSGTVLAGVGAIYWGTQARQDDADLESCYLHCPQPQVDHVRREYLWTNISIGVAATGLATAVVLWLVSGRSSPSSARAAGMSAGTF